MIPRGLSETIDLSKIKLQKLSVPLFNNKGISMDILRTDLIHPVISGNKWFKLKYHLQDAKQNGKTGIISFGGAFSNHLLAITCACAIEGLNSVGIIRGEEPAIYSPTLLQLQEWGMELHFVSRNDYRNKTALQEKLSDQFSQYYWVNEGGQGPLGIKGAAEMLQLVTASDYSHIACAVGTGTMMAGLMNAALPHQRVVGVSALKIPDQQENELLSFLTENSSHNSFEILYDYHEGGYAQKTESLIRFMNDFYRHHSIPSDFVYTAKLFNAIMKQTEAGYFPPGSKILVIHSGGLQGNQSLPAGSLLFI